jgi:PDZ domain-containing protein
VDGCGVVVSVGTHDAHLHAARLAAALAERLPSPVVCTALDRHGLAALADVAGPLVVVGPRCRPDRLRAPLEGDVLACLDGSARAESVLPTAATWADALELDLWLLYAISAPDASALTRYPGDVLQNGYLARVVGALGGRASVAGWEVLHGHAAAAVVDHARHSRAAFIALNSHGGSTAARAAYGRVPVRVVMESPVPVLLTRVRDEPPAPAVPRPRPAPVARRPALRPRLVALPTQGDGLRVAARSYLSASVARRPASRAPSRWNRRRVFVVAVAALALLVTMSARVPLSYHRLGGTTRPAADLVTVAGTPVERTGGTILVTIVTSEPVTLAGAVGAWLGQTHDVQPDPDGTSASTFASTNRRLMAEAGATATAVALHHLGTAPGPVRVAVTPHGLGGPSAGLAMALELVDLLTPGDLTRGHRVAVSGVLESDGRVDPVGGIRYKAAAAERAGADVLLVPPAVARDAVLYAGSVRVVPVVSFEDALAALQAL